MNVVSNTSAVLNLALVGELSVLQRLFDEIVVPVAVQNELEVRLLKAGTSAPSAIPSWIQSRSVANRPLVDSLSSELDAGEAEAIALAVEMQADLVLLDERLARKVARRLGLRFIGILGILVEAKRRGVIPFVKPVLDALLAKQDSG